ncbi:hypothetical protein N3K64_04765 [Escherichia coli]|uniref:hypothetical protein n=1 Tax=Escherichia coli TaxID=562 RepID=UPI0021C0BEEC|nr:hypothetical protein [Escherichia coli]MCT9829202.1 hypothetical protein [Escherichia coli]
MTHIASLYDAYRKEVDARHYRHARNVRDRKDKMQVAILRRNLLRMRLTICPRGKAYWRLLAIENG